jgi:hypothetical protein
MHVKPREPVRCVPNLIDRNQVVVIAVYAPGDRPSGASLRHPYLPSKLACCRIVVQQFSQSFGRKGISHDAVSTCFSFAGLPSPRHRLSGARLMGLGPLGGTVGDVITAIGTTALFLVAAVGAVYIAISLTGYVILWLFGMLAW